ncbi:hypothetical protein DFJ74DRAFT_708972 [Hyaloraphidium curvatum]|nr:hypothetical protein DFJ74DRAFT_708972 [Hyaloraphidium curvatum]
MSAQPEESYRKDARWEWAIDAEHPVNRFLRRISEILSKGYGSHYMRGLEASPRPIGKEKLRVTLTISSLAAGFSYIGLSGAVPDFERSKFGSVEARLLAYGLFSFCSFGLCLLASLISGTVLGSLGEVSDQKMWIRQNYVLLQVPFYLCATGLTAMLANILVVVSTIYGLWLFVAVTAITFLLFGIALTSVHVSSSWVRHNQAAEYRKVVVKPPHGAKIMPALTSHTAIFGEEWKGFVDRPDPRESEGDCCCRRAVTQSWSATTLVGETAAKNDDNEEIV